MLAIPLALIGGAVDFLVNFFVDLFGGGSTPEIPRQLRHKRHPLYDKILGFPDGEIPTEASAGPTVCSDPGVSSTPVLQKQTPAPGPTPTPPPAAPWLPPLTCREKHIVCSCNGGIACAAGGLFFEEVPPIMLTFDIMCLERQEHFCDQEYPCQ